MAASTFSNLHLHMLAMGQISPTQILALYPGETVTTLTAAVAAQAAKEPTQVVTTVSVSRAVATKL